MIYLSLIFFIVAITAAFFGFGGTASTAATIAQILFFVSLALFVISLIAGLFSSRRGPRGI